ncbi:hypothetical protein TorRG33x02_330200, partial [Trema orientale]
CPLLLSLSLSKIAKEKKKKHTSQNPNPKSQIPNLILISLFFSASLFHFSQKINFEVFWGRASEREKQQKKIQIMRYDQREKKRSPINAREVGRICRFLGLLWVLTFNLMPWSLFL